MDIGKPLKREEVYPVQSPVPNPEPHQPPLPAKRETVPAREDEAEPVR